MTDYNIYSNAQIPALIAEQPVTATIVCAANNKESCEALLSRFAAHWSGHPSATTVSQGSDLFVMLPVVSRTVPDGCNTVAASLVASVGNLLSDLAVGLIKNDRHWHFMRSKAIYVRPSGPTPTSKRWPVLALGLSPAASEKMVVDTVTNLVSTAMIHARHGQLDGCADAGEITARAEHHQDGHECHHSPRSPSRTSARFK